MKVRLSGGCQTVWSDTQSDPVAKYSRNDAGTTAAMKHCDHSERVFIRRVGDRSQGESLLP